MTAMFCKKRVYHLASLAGLLLLVATKIYCQPVNDTTIMATEATPQLISRQFSFTEGPAVDKYGNVFFTDQPNNKIWKYSTDGKLSVFLENAGRSNGMYFDKKGNLITCADEHNQLWSISQKGKVTVVLKNYKGHQLNGPNDLWISKSGAIYFTDPYYQRDYWTRKKPDIEGQKVYYLAKGDTASIALIENLKQPNGIIGSADGRWLYVADIGAGKTFRYGINKDGLLSAGQLFAAMGSDGMTTDERGNVYLTGNGVAVFNPDGKQIAHIAIPEKWTANVTFGGKDRNQLFITASQAIYILKMRVRGVK